MKRMAFLLLVAALAACAHQSSRLETSPRHDEWVRVESSGRTLHAYVVYPQTSRKAGSVVVIHENRGLTDWVRTVADRLAEWGFIAIAPDLLSGMAPNGGRTSDFASQDAAREAISKLNRDQVMTDLKNTVAYVRAFPSANGRVAVAGFCWGGSRTFDFANAGQRLSASFVFYGAGPQDAGGTAAVDAPVYGFYGGDDARVNATIERTSEVMKANGKRYVPVIYPGAGHAFMRLGEEGGASEANRKARDQAWTRWRPLLDVLY